MMTAAVEKTAETKPATTADAMAEANAEGIVLTAKAIEMAKKEMPTPSEGSSVRVFPSSKTVDTRLLRVDSMKRVLRIGRTSS